MVGGFVTLTVTMPEGPEVRRSADTLSQLLVGKRIVNAFPGKKGRYADNPPDGYTEFLGDLRGRGSAEILEVNCKGKFMWWKLAFPMNHTGPRREQDFWYMWCTYGMSGQWTADETPYTAFGVEYAEANSPADVQPPSLYFNDTRHFGTLKFVNSDKDHAKKLASLGPDMLNDPPTWQVFMDRLLKKPQKTLAEVLMDQSVISGVGNYVKAEALYLSELSPHRTVDSLKMAEMERLRNQIMNVMKASLNTGGATFSTYRNPDGSKGRAQSRFVVYGNKTDPLGNPVVREDTLDGRTTHWVPAIQR